MGIRFRTVVCSDGQVENASARIRAFQDEPVRLLLRVFFFGFRPGTAAYVTAICPMGVVNIEYDCCRDYTLIDDDGTKDERCLGGV